jgi:hypothetical protein
VGDACGVGKGGNVGVGDGFGVVVAVGDGVGVGVAVVELVVNDDSLPYDVPPLLLAAMR